MYRGIYNAKVKHPDDFEAVLQRGRDHGLKYLMATAGCYTDAIESLKFCANHGKSPLSVALNDLTQLQRTL